MYHAIGNVARKTACAFAVYAMMSATATAAPPAHAPGSMSVAAGELVYYAAAGDTLTSIAQKLTTSSNNWSVLGKLNHVGNDRRIPIGSAVLIPANLLPDDPSEASVSAFSGQVTLTPVGGSPATATIGSKILEGGEVTTGNNGFVTFALPDGSHISLPSNSRVKLTLLRMARYIKSPRTEVTLIEGNVESRVSSLEANKGRYEVHSVLATAGVRGTHFRVALVGKGVANEVLGGMVAVGAAAKPASLDLTAGSGNIVDAKSVGKAVPLLPPPDLATGNNLQERTVVQFVVKDVPGAAAYHAQIALDKDAQDILAEVHSQGNKLKLDGLADGDYFLRVTAIDESGLEGLPNVIPFKLKARPVPPFSAQPKAKLRADHVEFAWIEAPDAQYYHLQVAKDAAFSDMLIDQKQVTGLQFSSDKLAPGKYYWRTASVSSHDGKLDHGPFNDAQAFDLLEPQKLAPITDQGGNEFSFSWPSEPGQKFEVQIGRDPAFKSLLLSKNTEQAEIRMPRPDVGTYYVRVKATDPDGYVGAYSAAQKFTIQSRWTTGTGGELKSESGPVRAGFGSGF